MNACGHLVELARELAVADPTPRQFLYRLGARAAGIRRGPVGYLDLARGGRNIFPGGREGDGVAPQLDDDTGGQIRHFAGIVAASVRVGAGAASWLSVHVGRDAENSADGRMTDAAASFSRQLLSGDLAVADAPDWIARHVCE